MHLGLWQHGKAERTEAAVALAAQRDRLAPQVMGALPVDGAQANGARFTVRGEYEAAQQFFVDNRQENGVPGVHVVTPLRIAGSSLRVLVNRGWIGWPHGRGELPQVPVPAGEVQLTGRADLPSTKPFFLMHEPAGQDPRLWTRIDLARYAAQSHNPVQPVVLLQDPADAQDGLIRHWPPPEDRTAMHRGYAIQWFAMALALVVFHTVASLRRRP